MKELPSARISGWVLLADIGGTNARFAFLADGTLSAVVHMAVHNYTSFREALDVYLGGLPNVGMIRAAIIAASGTIDNDRCTLTNNAWIIDAAELRGTYRISTVRLINDFEAVAWSLPSLSSDMLLQLGGREPVKAAPAVALGPGTGLGMAIYIPHGNGPLVLSSEGGHSTMPGISLREDAVIDHLRQRFGHVSAERVLSGSGLENLYGALAAIDQLKRPTRCAAEIVQAALAGTCSTSRAAVDMFCAMLGSVAGNLALTLGARAGVFIGGGILCHMPDYIGRSQFRERFEEKGRFKKHLETIPAYLILKTDVAFTGMCALAEAEGIV